MKGHIRQRSPGRWAIVIDLRDPATGKRRRKWHKFAGTTRKAQDECSRLISEMQRGTYLEPNKTTVAQFLDVWLADVKQRVSPKTYERYEQVCHKNIAPLLGAVLVSKLKPVQISEAYAKAFASGRRKRPGGLSPRTVHHMHVILKGALAQAVKWEMLVRNPAAAVDAPKAGHTTIMRTYDLGQTAELIEAVRGKRIFVPAILAVLCGLRRGEIAALRWSNVDLVKGQLAVVQSAEQTRQAFATKNPKVAARAPLHSRGLSWLNLKPTAFSRPKSF
jgi:integrase